MSSYDGTLQLYPVPDAHALPMFLSGKQDSQKAIILIGGLTDGMCSLPYQGRLSELCERKGWTLAQPHWTSAYEGFGLGSLERDVKELRSAVKHLRSQVKETIILMGCSTGCQDVLQYALTAHTSNPVEGVILQAPVSDREAFSLPELAELATRMREEGKADQLVPKELAKGLCGLEKLTAYRAWSLLGIGGDDDYFSSDLPLDDSEDKGTGTRHRPLSATFGSLPRNPPKILCLFSEKDDYFPWTKTTPQKQFDRWLAAAKRGKNGKDLVMDYKIIASAGHQVEQIEGQDCLLEVLNEWMDDCQ